MRRRSLLRPLASRLVALGRASALLSDVQNIPDIRTSIFHLLDDRRFQLRRDVRAKKFVRAAAGAEVVSFARDDGQSIRRQMLRNHLQGAQRCLRRIDGLCGQDQVETLRNLLGHRAPIAADIPGFVVKWRFVLDVQRDRGRSERLEHFKVVIREHHRCRAVQKALERGKSHSAADFQDGSAGDLQISGPQVRHKVARSLPELQTPFVHSRDDICFGRSGNGRGTTARDPQKTQVFAHFASFRPLERL
mmetsp:Transcript_18403/g.69617  ORF Transcript_18403/g.69617 Transcript_18403/m.69617 type:complete len:248 (+) Transcript_18403:3076-3819(+)